jgi:ATP-dependent DNA ligase
MSVVLDGEICCLDPDGRSNFRRLMFRRDWPFFPAFDVISIDGRDIRGLSLLARKRLLRSVMPKVESRLRYPDLVKERGTDLYRARVSATLSESWRRRELFDSPVFKGHRRPKELTAVRLRFD